MKNRNRYCHCLVAFAAILVMAGSASAQQLTKLRFTLDWRYEGQLAMFMMAKSKGYFEREGLDVQMDAGSGSGAAINRIVGGSHDIGTGDLSSLIEYVGNNPGPTRLQAVYLIYSRSPFMIQALKKSGMTKPQDLVGKRVAAPVFDSTRKTFPIFAKLIGIDPKEVTFINADPAVRETLVARGQIDASAGFELHKLTMIARGIREEDIVTFVLADYGFKMYGNAILASEKLIKENPKAVAAFVRASNRALIDTIANPGEAIKYNKEFDGLIDEKLELEKLKITLHSIDTEFARLHGLGSIDKRDLESQIESISAVFNLKTTPNIDQIFNPMFLPPVGERMPRAAK